MPSRPGFDRLQQEIFSAVAGRFTVLHLVAVVCGLGAATAVNVGWSITRFGVVLGPIVAALSGVAADRLSFVAVRAVDGGLVGLAICVGWYDPEPTTTTRGDDPA